MQHFFVLENYFEREDEIAGALKHVHAICLRNDLSIQSPMHVGMRSMLGLHLLNKLIKQLCEQP